MGLYNPTEAMFTNFYILICLYIPYFLEHYTYFALIDIILKYVKCVGNGIDSLLVEYVGLLSKGFE